MSLFLFFESFEVDMTLDDVDLVQLDFNLVADRTTTCSLDHSSFNGWIEYSHISALLYNCL